MPKPGNTTTGRGGVNPGVRECVDGCAPGSGTLTQAIASSVATSSERVIMFGRLWVKIMVMSHESDR